MYLHCLDKFGYTVVQITKHCGKLKNNPMKFEKSGKTEATVPLKEITNYTQYCSTSHQLHDLKEAV